VLGGLGKMSKIESIEASLAISKVSLRADPRSSVERAPLWDQWHPGQMLELSGSSPGKLSTVARLLLRAQSEGDPCAWVSPREEASFYPPDFARMGIDLAALAVVRLPVEAGAHGVVRASELLLRSGAFGLVVVDFSQAVPRGELAWQSRLSGLLRMHDARVVLLTPTEAHEPSIGPMVGLRLQPQLHALTGARVSLGQRVLKSKLGGGIAISPDIREPPLGAEFRARAVVSARGVVSNSRHA
jgi:hypothetical protein